MPVSSSETQTPALVHQPNKMATGGDYATKKSFEPNTVESDKSAIAANYQEIVDKLHKLGNEITTRTLTNDGRVIETPPGSPVSGNVTDNQISETDTARSREPVLTDEFGIQYVQYQSELQMSDIMALISKDLSEPYSIYTYRYFIHNWPGLCFLAMDDSTIVGTIVCKLDPHKRTMRQRGYIAMLAVDHDHRRKKIGSKLVSIAIEAMIREEADEVVLETEVTNVAAIKLYENLGFVRDKRLYKYYLNGRDAFRLKLWIT